MRYAFIFVVMFTVSMAMGCGKAEVKREADPDPRVSDPYRGSALDVESTKPKQDKAE